MKLCCSSISITHFSKIAKQKGMIINGLDSQVYYPFQRWLLI